MVSRRFGIDPKIILLALRKDSFALAKVLQYQQTFYTYLDAKTLPSVQAAIQNLLCIHEVKEPSMAK